MLWGEVNWRRITRWKGISEAAACSLAVRGWWDWFLLCAFFSVCLWRSL